MLIGNPVFTPSILQFEQEVPIKRSKDIQIGVLSSYYVQVFSNKSTSTQLTPVTSILIV